MARPLTQDGRTVRETLDLFCRRGQELLDKRAVRDGHFNISLSLHFQAGKGLSTTSKEPDEETLQAFLVTFRQFVSNDEPIFVNKIHNLLHLRLRSDELRGHLADARRQWGQACKVGSFGFVHNGRTFEPAQIMDFWINGRIFHNDERKAKAIDQLDPLGQLFHKHNFLNHIITATNYIAFLGQVIVVSRRQCVIHED